MRIGIYLADQVWRRTKSKGIYSYSRSLVAELTRRLPEHAFFILCNRDNHADMVPAGSSAEIVVLPSALASGVSRLVGDHLIAPWLARRLALDLIHFPKGFTPEIPVGEARISATIHDTIPLWYAENRPGHFSPWRIRYLRRMYTGSLRRCHYLATDSDFSRRVLLALARQEGIEPPPIEVCYLCPGVEFAVSREERLGDALAKSPRTLLHLGSALPHKRTRETVELFRDYCRRRGEGWLLRVVGLEKPLPEWGLPLGADVEWLGPLDGPALRLEMRRARALLLLSSIEGFGLPALESWFLGTPVCFTGAGSVGEILAGVPGLCSDDDEDSFVDGLDAVLSMGVDERENWSNRLREQYSIERFGRRCAALFADWLGAVRQ
jgi:hypothetical protein